MLKRNGVGLGFSMIVSLGQLGCMPIDTQNGVDPLPGINADIVTQNGVQVWQTTRDNPPIWSRIDLRRTQSAIRGPLPGSGVCPAFGGCADAWEYGRFNLTAAQGTYGGPLGNPLVTWPLGIGLYEGEGSTCSDCEGPTMSWEAHGLKLAPRVTGAPLEGVTEVQARRDDFDTAEAPEGTPGRFQLSPNVAVVPIRLIVTNPSANEVYAPGWFSQAEANLLFDDNWKADVSINTEPGLSPDNVVGKWTNRIGCTDPGCKRLNMLQPDTIFEQCNVQFRIVDYRTCTVSQKAWINEFQNSSQCSATQQAKVINQELKDCIGTTALNDVITTVVITGELRNPNATCLGGEAFGAAGENSKFVYITASSLQNASTEYVMAHEFGHRLGIDHPIDSEEVCIPKQLMCPFAPQMTEDIPTELCNIVHANALKRQNEYWQ